MYEYKGVEMTLDTLKDGDRIYVNGDEYIFHCTTMLGDEKYMRCTKIKSNVPMLVRCTDDVQDVR